VYTYYHIVEVDRPGYTSVGAQSSSGGQVVNPNWIRHRPVAPGTYNHNDFWDEQTEVTPTPTSSALSLFFAGYVMLDLPNPEGIPGSQVDLYRRNGDTWLLVDTDISDEAGHFSLTDVGPIAQLYMITQTNLPNYESVRAEVPSPDWTIVNPDEVRATDEQTTGCVYFFDTYLGPSPTPTETEIPIPSATPTPTSTPICVVVAAEAEHGSIEAPMVVGSDSGIGVRLRLHADRPGAEWQHDADLRYAPG